MKNKRINILCFFAALTALLVIAGVPRGACAAGSVPEYIRVGLYVDGDDMRLIPPDDENADAPAEAPFTEFNGSRYRGTLEYNIGANGKLTVVNVVRLEEYLYGVVPREIQSSSDPEAIKAQAVAARTYAVNAAGKHGASGFDICTTTHCQVYGGYTAEKERATQAVDDTAGEIVMYQGAPAAVFYFSSSGGRTEDAENVWGMSGYPYLKSVADPYESGDSTNYNWETVISAQEMKRMLSDNGVDIGDIVSVEATDMSGSGRVMGITVTGTNGSRAYSRESCRTFLRGLNSQMYAVFAPEGGGAYQADGANGAYQAVGANGIYQAVGAGGIGAISLFGKTAVGEGGGTSRIGWGSGGVAATAAGYAGFTARGATYRFVGRGWGHGVGMSQEGARGMATAGYSYAEIIKYYFPGCEIIKL